MDFRMIRLRQQVVHPPDRKIPTVMALIMRGYLEWS
jgi:hypothetical protein